jgi:hypothetical protein
MNNSNAWDFAGSEEFYFDWQLQLIWFFPFPLAYQPTFVLV